MMDWIQLTLMLSHVFAVISWLGAMYFNLVLIFPGYRRATDSIDAEKHLYQVQGTRAGYWLYAFIGITAVTGLLMVATRSGSASWQDPSLLDQRYLIKTLLLVLMAGCHLVGSYVIWPRIMFALGDEARAPLNAYKLTMLVSATLGSLLVVLSYYWMLQPEL